ncbi:HD-GYP domain-containing protein [Thiocystis violacea]|uniref:HD-GYP domain-containing protein n=1 Tax=Thiocystis violacea TaxID=13725 RepID=UPI0019032463|nr:HD-GYP domain-containing protein [Thiocystis violacea]MBK1724454.1 phosphodiesterase [Thiocystis violacea]
MIKKITIDELQIGMFIHDLNCGWMEHGFLRNRFMLKAEANLVRIRELGIHELYIDTDKGLDVSQAPTEMEVEEALEQDLVQVAAEKDKPEQHETSLAEERIHARRIHNEALGLLNSLSEDIRHNRPVSLEHLDPLVDDMVASVLRNPDALMGFSRVRRLGRYQLEHGVNVSSLLVAFGQTLGLDRDSIRGLAMGGLLHDIGKAFLPASILNKPGQLTEEEFGRMRQHVADGFRIASQMPDVPKIALAIIAEHHERMDGSGYPRQRKGSEITRYGQMAGIVDVYDAITSDRVYNKALEPHEALRKLLEWSAYHFNPELVQQFIRCVGIYPLGTLVRLRSGRLGVVVETGRKGLFHPVVRVVMDANRRSYIKVQDVDLSRLGKGSEERILNAESPKDWRINPVEVLQLPS